MQKYDLIVIGSGPGGEKAAVKAAYFGYRVALVEKESKFGGVCVNQGTIPSKSLKETSLYFSGKYDRGLYGIERTFSRQASIEDFMYRKNSVITSEEKDIFFNLIQHKVDIYRGMASFKDEHMIQVKGETLQEIYGQHVLIATGSYPFHPTNIPFDAKRVHDSDTILQIKRLPKSLCVVGAGVIGCEYATIFSTIGTKVYLVNRTNEILPFIDQELARGLITQMQQQNIEILFNNSVEEVQVPNLEDKPLTLKLEKDGPLEVDMFLFAAGRSGNTQVLDCEKLGIKFGKRQFIEVDEHYRTSVPNIYAVGDVIGFPSLASTSMDQGRVAVTHMFNTGDLDALAKVFPYGIYTIPEVSMVGVTEEEAKKEGMNYCLGRARHADLPRGKIMGVGENDGLLKIIFSRDDLVIRGVHIIGPLASEIIHYGITLVSNKNTLMQVISTVFNYPTLHELYKYACYDGLSNRHEHKMKN